MSKFSLLFVGKLVNSPLLTAFPASSRKILSDFSFATALRKGLYKEFLVGNNFFNQILLVLSISLNQPANNLYARQQV